VPLITIQSPGVDQTPASRFSILFLVAGIDITKISAIPIAKNAWDQVQSVAPLLHKRPLPPSSAFAVFCDAEPIGITFQQQGKQLVVPDAQKSAILDRINQQTLRLYESTQAIPPVWPARRVWDPVANLGEEGGSLVVVLNPSLVEGEFYQLTSTPDCPMPFVAVNMFGANWHKVIVRAIGQTMAFLDDEYELPGDENSGPTMDISDRARTNVILLTDSDRALLVNNTNKFHDVIKLTGNFARGWLVGKDAVLPFVKHPSDGAAPDNTLHKATGGIRLIEGGAGYRLRALRCDVDCLMRRKPYSTDLPIQDTNAEFCQVCNNIMSLAVTRKLPSFDWEKQRVLLDSQRPVTDMVYWKHVVKSSPTRGAVTPELRVGPRGATWDFKWSLDDTLGFKVTDLKLHDLSGVIYAPTMNIFAQLGFRNLLVKFAGESPRALAFADAFGNTKTPPVFEILDQPDNPKYIAGYRLSLTWAIPNRWDVEAVLSFVIRDINNDFDPGGAVNALKCYPQLSMRYKRPAIATKAKLPKVEFLQGTIEMTPNNVIPTSLESIIPGHLHHMANGDQSVALFTDSNASRWDSEFDWTSHGIAEFANNNAIRPLLNTFGANRPESPPFGIWTAVWQSGRLLSTVDWGSILDPDSVVGATARRAHLFFDKPTLPHWSWLFDYVLAEMTGTRRLVGTYSTKDTVIGGGPATSFRIAQRDWPVVADQKPVNLLHVDPTPLQRPYTRLVEKRPRQGGFDNVHIHPNMGIDDNGQQIVPAPFCGDLCLHVHWRWGLVALQGAIDRQLFTGWGSGRMDRGAHTTDGAPLIPPNQHLEVNLEKQTGQTVMQYEVRADDPDFNAFQVFLEQGVGIAFDYGGLDGSLLTQLSAALHEVAPADLVTDSNNLVAMKKSNPRGYDELARLRFHAFYPKIRFFHEKDVNDNVQQSPNQDNTDNNLEHA
jgi:hypothetical protein